MENRGMTPPASSAGAAGWPWGHPERSGGTRALGEQFWLDFGCPHADPALVRH